MPSPQVRWNGAELRDRLRDRRDGQTGRSSRTADAQMHINQSFNQSSQQHPPLIYTTTYFHTRTLVPNSDPWFCQRYAEPVPCSEVADEETESGVFASHSLTPEAWEFDELGVIATSMVDLC